MEYQTNERSEKKKHILPTKGQTNNTIKITWQNL